MAAPRDAVIVGAGPNGLTAAIVLARAGLSVEVLEANETIGGGCRTESLTLPGYRHDVCAAIHPMGVVSPVFQRLDLHRRVEWLSAPVPLAHPLDDGSAGVLSRQLTDMRWLPDGDGQRWVDLMAPFAGRHEPFFGDVLRPVRVPRHPLLMARFGLVGLQSCERVLRRFRSPAARALFAGSAAHSCIPLSAAGSASFGVVLAVAGHAVDWPCAAGGSQRIVEALAAMATEAGCTIRTARPVRTLADLPPARATLFDLTPRQLLAIAGSRFSSRYRRQLQRYVYGAGVFKIDYALSEPIPWTSPVCRKAATVHVGGTAEEVARSEAEVNAGVAPAAPFVLVAQQSHMDPSRAPRGAHTGWAYCHVPNGSTVDMTARIEQQIERFAPGFREVVRARHVIAPAALQAHNANMIGGDIGGGANTLRQFLLRPVARWDPYATSDPGLFLCSSSTPPGGGVHGMCGYWAAVSALRRRFRRDPPAALAL